MAIGRVNTGGGSGATLVITGVAGDTCTISKSGKTKSKTFGSDGKATFKGLETGTWTVTMTNTTGSTATQTVTINADYTLTIAYFSATIAVTYPAGSTCTCVNGSTTLTAVGTTGSYTFTVPNAGTWVVSCTNGTDTASESVSITADGQSETVALNYGTYLIDYEEYPNYDTWSWKNYPVNNNDPNPSRVTVSRGESGLTIPGGSGFNNFYGTDNIDLTSFTTLHIAFTITKATGWGGYLGVLSGTASRFDGNFLASISISNSLVGNNLTRSIDISSVTGSHKIGVGYFGGLDIVLHQVWLT